VCAEERKKLHLRLNRGCGRIGWGPFLGLYCTTCVGATLLCCRT
jgi:hypothetical protein